MSQSVKSVVDNKTPWYVGGLHFECLQCGVCCSGPESGYIWVTKPEVQLIADYLKITTAELTKKYLKRRGLRTTIIEQPLSRDCIFLQNTKGLKRCAIYPVRPSQCRTWPFWPDNLTGPEAWNFAAGKCPGVNRGKLYSLDEIESFKKQKRWWINAGQLKQHENL